LDERVRMHPLVAGGGGVVDRLGEHTIGPAQIAAQPLNDADVRHEINAGRVIGRKKLGGARHERDCRFCVAAKERPVPRRREATCRFASERNGRFVDESDLGAVRERLLEVIADDLVVTGRPVPRAALQPMRKTLV
jgi:hypothetical protein